METQGTSAKAVPARRFGSVILRRMMNRPAADQNASLRPNEAAVGARAAEAAAVPSALAAPSTVADLGQVRAVIDALPEAVFVMESDGELRLTNPAADRLFEGRPVADRADLLGRFEAVAPERGRHRSTIAATEDATDNLTLRSRDQPNRWFTLRTVDLDPAIDPPPAPTGPALAEASPGGTVFVVRDITDSRDLRPVREAFLAVLSHELRTPITTIYAGSSVLARRPTLSPAATRTLAGDISAEAARLYDLVEDLLVLARLERRVLDPLDEPILVQRAVDMTLRMIEGRLGDVPIERRGDADVPPVHGDSTYIDQACRNLFMASIRFAAAGPGQQLVVDVRADREAGEVRVAVLDRGPELTEDELERAFELPTSTTTGRLAGSGVGPFVCRHLVAAMGGRVWAANRPDGGLEMGFALRIDERA
jgi:signal transduction histidine kinase